MLTYKNDFTNTCPYFYRKLFIVKNIIIFLTLIFSTTFLHAQLYVGGVVLDSIATGKYISVCPEFNQTYTSCKAAVDYGQGRYTVSQIKNRFYLTYENGEIIKFRSGVAVLNLMIKYGYEPHFLESASICNLYYRRE